MDGKEEKSIGTGNMAKLLQNMVADNMAGRRENAVAGKKGTPAARIAAAGVPACSCSENLIRLLVQNVHECGQNHGVAEVDEKASY